ncbi:MAG: hydrogenase 3 maturation endopeptidase HyCI [Elusimicrobiota bacterium]
MENIFINLKKPVLIVGIGNIMKGDDAVGPVLAENIIVNNKKTSAINCGEIPENYLRRITSSGAKTVVLADAVDMGSKPGTYKIFGYEELDQAGVSTHGISLALIADTIKQECGADVVLLGIQPKSIKLGESMSPEVEKAVSDLVSMIE